MQKKWENEEFRRNEPFPSEQWNIYVFQEMKNGKITLALSLLKKKNKNCLFKTNAAIIAYPTFLASREIFVQSIISIFNLMKLDYNIKHKK